jgi:hypothetical protein
MVVFCFNQLLHMKPCCYYCYYAWRGVLGIRSYSTSVCCLCLLLHLLNVVTNVIAYYYYYLMSSSIYTTTIFIIIAITYYKFWFWFWLLQCNMCASWCYRYAWSLTWHPLEVINISLVGECKVKWLVFGVTMVFFCWVPFVQMHMVINLSFDLLMDNWI